MKQKVLSVKQPWSFLICSGIKPIENRSWKCPQKYIGERVLIHASGDKKLNLSNLTREQYNDACDKFDWNSTTVKPVDRWDRSAIIGSVRFVDCTINHPSIWAEKTEVINDPEFTFLPAYGKKTYNWVVADPILFDKPILNVKGKLGFWNYELPEEYENC